MNKIELHLLYKNETSDTREEITANAYMSKTSFDVILESDDLDERILKMLPNSDYVKGRYTTITFEDPEYVKWMENKLLELLNP